MIRVFLVEDDPHWVSLFQMWLAPEPDIQVVGTADSHKDALERIEGLSVDVVLMDVHLQDDALGGIYAALALTQQNRTAAVIMLSSDERTETITRSFAAGAVNYLSKSNTRMLAESIRLAASGQELPMDTLRKEYLRLRREDMLRDLTVSEREIFELLESGYTMGEIQGMLFKEKSTLKTHINRMLRKLGARSMNEAIEKVKQLGL